MLNFGSLLNLIASSSSRSNGFLRICWFSCWGNLTSARLLHSSCLVDHFWWNWSEIDYALASFFELSCLAAVCDRFGKLHFRAVARAIIKDRNKPNWTAIAGARWFAIYSSERTNDWIDATRISKTVNNVTTWCQ